MNFWLFHILVHFQFLGYVNFRYFYFSLPFPLLKFVFLTNMTLHAIELHYQVIPMSRSSNIFDGLETEYLISTLNKYTAQKMKFSMKDFFSKCHQIRIFLRIWSHLLKKSLEGNFIFCAVVIKCACLKIKQWTFKF